MLRPARPLLALAAVLGLVALTGTGVAAQDATAHEEVVAIAADQVDADAQPIVATWRDARLRDRWSFQIDPSYDLEEWQIHLTTNRWRGKPVRTSVRTRQGVPSATITEITADGPVSQGSTAALFVGGVLSIDLPGGATELSSLLVTSASGDVRVRLAPIPASMLLDISNNGLQTPPIGQGSGAGLPVVIDVPPGPAVTRERNGMRITMLSPPPTAVNEVAVASLRDEVVIRTTADPAAPIVLRLVIIDDLITAETADGSALVAGGEPWELEMPTDLEVGVPLASITFDELELLAGEPLDASMRVGVERRIDLEGGGSVLADGLDVVHPALPLARPLTRAVVAADEADEASRTWILGLVGVGLLIVVVVALPAVRYRRMARSARRGRRRT